MRHRVILLIILIGAVAYVPWWVSVLLAISASWRFDSGYELLLPAALADLVYGAPIPQLFNFAFPVTFLTALAMALGQTFGQRFFKQS